MIFTRRFFKRLVALAAISIMCCGVWYGMAATKRSQALADTCKSVVVIYARGSGQAVGSDEERLFREGITSYVGASDGVAFIELSRHMPGTSGDYPAVGISGLPTGDPRIWAPQAVNAIGAKLSVSWVTVGAYKSSIASGKELLLEFLQSANNRSFICSTTRFVLAGYSQGAQVIGDALADPRMRLYDTSLLSVQLFGDPTLNYRSGAFDRELGAWYRGPAGGNVGGIIKRRAPYLPTTLVDKVGSWCRNRDGICGNSLFFSEHLGYRQREVALAASESGAAIERWLQKQQILTASSCSPKKQDIVMAIDMGESVLASGLFQPDVLRSEMGSMLGTACSVRVGVVGYYPAAANKAPERLLDFTSESEVFVSTLSGQGKVGANYTYLGQSQLREGMLLAAGMAWREDAQKVVIVHAKSQSTGWHSTTNYGNVVDDAARSDYHQDPLTIEVEKAFAERNLEFRFNLATVTPQDIRDYQGNELGALEDLAELLGGRAVSYGCSGYCYWRLLGTFGEKPQFRALPVRAKAGEVFTPKIVDTSEGIIAAAASGHRLQYEWDFDGDGFFEVRSNSLASTEGAIKVNSSRHCTGFARIKVLVNGGGPSAVYDSYTATMPVDIDSGEVSAVPQAVGVLARPTGARSAEVFWAADSDGANRTLSYVVRTREGELMVVTPNTSLELRDLPLAQEVELQVAARNQDGLESAARTILVGSPTSSSVKPSDPNISSVGPGLGESGEHSQSGHGLGVTNRQTLENGPMLATGRISADSKGAESRSKAQPSAWGFITIVAAALIGILLAGFVTIKGCRKIIKKRQKKPS